MPIHRRPVRTSVRARRLTLAALALVAGSVLAVQAAAHDFWIIPTAMQVPEGGTLEVMGQTSTRFPSTLAAVAVARVAAARVVGAGGTTPITELSHRGRSLVLRQRPAAPGQYLVAVDLVPATARSTAASLREWLALEGAPGEAARLDKAGAFAGPDSVTRRTTKYAKTLAQVGTGGPRMFTRPAGQRLEFVLDGDPARARVGDTLSLRLLYDGRPVTTAEAAASGADWPITEGDSVPMPQDVHLQAAAGGVLRLPVTRTGLWNIRGIHVTPTAGGAPRAWDVHWATFTFQVGDVRAPSGTASVGGAGGMAGHTAMAGHTGMAAASDSTAVVQALRQLDERMASGDSLGVLALMTDDIVVLEGGGIESRSEYRSHHLAGDVAFARAVKRANTIHRVTVRGDVAWVSSTSTAQGTYNGRPVNSAGAELATLVRTPTGWRIAAIHWSSRARRG